MLTLKDYCDKDLSASLMEMGFRSFGHFYYEKDSSKLKATHQFLTVRTAKALGHTLAISLYETQKWLREEKKIEVNATYDNIVELHWHWYMKSLINRNQTISITIHDSYEQALLAGIKEAVKILKKKYKSYKRKEEKL